MIVVGVGYAEDLKMGVIPMAKPLFQIHPEGIQLFIIHSNSKSLDRVPNLFVGATCGRPQNVSILSENS